MSIRGFAAGRTRRHRDLQLEAARAMRLRHLQLEAARAMRLRHLQTRAKKPQCQNTRGREICPIRTIRCLACRPNM